MLWFLAAALALASTGSSSAQVPTAIKDVAKFVEQRTFRGVTYPVYEYQGVFVEGDISLQDYNEATAVVRRELREAEQIIQVFASQQLPQRRDNEKDMSVQTCIGSCGPKAEGVKTADGKIQFTVGGGEGRYFIFERVSGKLQLSAMWNWIA